MGKKHPLDRHWCSELVSLIRMEKSRPPEVIPANLEEIGKRTAVVLTEDSVPIGAKLQITCKGHRLKGIAESCRFDELLGFFVQIRLARKSRWNPSRFTPEHLLRPLQVTQWEPAMSLQLMKWEFRCSPKAMAQVP